MIPCCCPTPSCIIFSDDFSTDRTGSDYTTHSGSFTVGSSTIHTTSSGASITANTATPTGHGHTSIEGKASATGGSFFLAGAYQDASNFLYVEMVINGSLSTIKTFKVVGGVPTQIGTTITFTGSLDTYYLLDLCWDGTTSYSVSSAGDCYAMIGAFTPAGGYAGFGASPGSGTVTFRNFNFYKTQQDDPACLDCNSSAEQSCSDCTDGKIPDLVKGTVTGMGAVTGGTCAGGGLCNFLDGSWIMCGSGASCGWGNATQSCLSFPGPPPTLCNTPTFVPCEGDDSDIHFSRSGGVAVVGGRLLAFGSISISGTPVVCSPRNFTFSADLGPATAGEVDCISTLRAGIVMPVTGVSNGCGGGSDLICGSALADYAGVTMTLVSI